MGVRVMLIGTEPIMTSREWKNRGSTRNKDNTYYEFLKHHRISNTNFLVGHVYQLMPKEMNV